MRRIGWTAVLALMLASCGGDPAGTPCQHETGALGFGLSSNCANACLALWDVACPDGSTVREAVCSGQQSCQPGNCPDGQACYAFPDAFEDRSYCVPVSLCGLQSGSPTVAQWEQSAYDEAARVRAEYADKKARRSGQTTAPADQPLPNDPTPKAQPPSPAPSATTSGSPDPASVLVASWDMNVALVACIEDDVVALGQDCSKFIPTGLEFEHGSSRVRAVGPTKLECRAMSTTVPGIEAESIGVAQGNGERWGWIAKPPPRWRPVSPTSLPADLELIARHEIAPPANARLEIAASDDLDGDPLAEKIVHVFVPSDDPDKPGHSQLWLVDDASVTRFPLDGLEVNGVITVRGLVRVPGEGALVVFTSEWMGGSGLHVVGPKSGALAPLAEAACGS